MKYGICLEMVFTDKPFLDRIQLAAKAGFKYAEMWFIDGTFNGADCASDPKNPRSVAKIASDSGITITNTVVGSPDGSLGGGLIDKAKRTQWLNRLQKTFEFNQTAGIGASIVCTGNILPDQTEKQMIASVIDGLKQTAEEAEKAGVTLLLEPLNTRVDHAGYLLSGSDVSGEICRTINSPRLKLLFDCYHMQIMEGDLVSHITKNMDVIGHFHLAGVPGRHEVFNSEVNYPFVVREIKKLGYPGVFAFEYTPLLDPMESLMKTLAYMA